MFLNNFYNLIALKSIAYIDKEQTLSPLNASGGGYYYYYQTSAQTLDYFPNLLKKVLTTRDGSVTGVLFGDGDTAVTAKDRNLSGNIITTITDKAVNITNTFSQSKSECTAIYTLTNTGTDDITIREVGIVTAFAYANARWSNCLVERTVLDTPVTIPAGGIGQVVYTISCNYLT